MMSRVKVNLRRNKTISVLGLISGLLLLASGLNIELKAQDRGEEILKKVEVQTTGERAPADIQAEMVMVIRTARGDEKRRELMVWTKNNPAGDDWRLMKFLAPADIKDLGFLVLADDQMYLYLPEFQRVRRIASHNKKESFVGSDFSYDDLGTAGFSAFFTPKFREENDRAWILELERKPGARKQYSKIVLTVDKATELPVRAELYDDSGQLFKVETQENSRVGKYWVPTKFVMENVRARTSTVLELRNVRVDQNLSAEIFTERNLKRSVSR
ncbi:MAG: Outer membrane lipoprotein-sorting protein [Candidatus Saccharicenans subterraneus]|uniref:Outer membrane lipoprotein-sorting protein n=1 Tax=Candidatus Saccharicenans subterraneus TaxID=2508984 RepID=A0A3E2BR29_9BACT|nr:MAG: Outer membrane lipoprotein-sorting protein [Candidatus Saccharicenans subterraneum]